MARSDRPGAFRWPPFQGPLSKISDRELERLKALGFDFIRLPVAPAPFLTVTEAEERILFDGVYDTVKRLQAAGFGVLVDAHPTHGGPRWSAPGILADEDGEEFKGYAEWLQRLARHLRNLPGNKTALGLMNEPQSECHILFGNDWTDMQPLLYAAVRKVAPDLAVVLTTGCWSSFDALEYLDMRAYDANTLVDIHYYKPHYYTHQGLAFASAPSRYLSGLWYPGPEGDPAEALRQSKRLIELRRAQKRGDEIPADALNQALEGISRYYDEPPPVDRAYIERHFDMMRAWVKGQGIDPRRLLIGEFGVARPPKGMPENVSRNAWLRDVREAAEASRFGWALWDYNAGDGYPGFGLVFDNKSRKIDTRAAAALGLNVGALSD